MCLFPAYVWSYFFNHSTLENLVRLIILSFDVHQAVLVITILGCLVQIETGNNRLEMQSVNNKSLVEELDKLLEKLRMPSEVFPYPLSFVGETVFYVMRHIC